MTDARLDGVVPVGGGRSLLEEDVGLHLQRVAVALGESGVFLAPAVERGRERGVPVLADLVEGLAGGDHVDDGVKDVRIVLRGPGAEDGPRLGHGGAEVSTSAARDSQYVLRSLKMNSKYT